MKAGGRSKGNKVPSRAGAAVQSAKRRSGRRVILIEPRELIRDCLANCMTVGDPGFAVLPYSSVHEVDSVEGADSIALVLSFLPADQKIPDVAAEVSRTQDELPNVPVVVVADGDELSIVRQLIGLGVRGYVPTSFDVAMFKEAIQFVAAGGTFVPSSVLRQPKNADMSDIDETNAPFKHARQKITIRNSNESQQWVPAAGFTPRELEVISCLKKGQSNKLIARKLTICEGTVKLHVRRIMKKLGVENRTQAALVATNMMLAE
jgi:DNA-binding NarL/FixJ family response regulator